MSNYNKSNIIINGHQLTIHQDHCLSCALEYYKRCIETKGFGDNDIGGHLRDDTLRHLNELTVMLDIVE